jgi:hypothetical protein
VFESGWDFLYVDCGDGEQSITSAGDVECSGTSASVRQDTDGSVTYAGFAMTWTAVQGVAGCMDSTACNYNADATVSGSCDYPGDACDCAIDGAGAGSTTSAGDSNWHSITLGDNVVGATFSICGASFDTKIEVHANCADGYIAYNDDNSYCAQYDDNGDYVSGSGLTSDASIGDAVSGGTYLVKVYGYSSNFGDYELVVTEQ